jgi:prepilin signal peptidase PulO-like enzyme (type II secretory pathway)
MQLGIFIIFFLLGTIVGSFLNVLIYRHNTGLTLGGRSFCFSCRKKLRWHELLPVVSFAVQRGRCKQCGSKIAKQYALVELATGILFGAIAATTLTTISVITTLQTFTLFVMASTLIVIFVYDLRHKIIPDLYVALFAVSAFTYTGITAYGAGESVLGILFSNAIAALIFFLFFAALWFFSKGKAMGFGDAKLAVGVGALLGLGKGGLALMIAFWTGAIIGAVLLLARKKYVTMKTEIPFAPFIILGVLVAWCINKTFFDVFIF